MPDVINDVQTLNLSRVDDFMDSERSEDSILSQLNNVNHQSANLHNLDHDPMLSGSAANHQQCSTVDMSAIDPINFGMLVMHHQGSGNGSVDSILQSDSDSLISDIDMMT